MSARLVAFAIAMAVLLPLKSCADEAAEREAQRARDAFVSAVDDLWLQALERGADRKRWPEIVFVERLMLEGGEVWAHVRCTQPRPVISVNERLLLTADPGHRWYAHELVIPHELAHVLVCLDGSPDDLADPHGEAWALKVRLLLPYDEAQDVLAEQAAYETTGGELPK